MAEPLSRPPHARTHRPLFTSLGGDCRWWSHRFLRSEKTRTQSSSSLQLLSKSLHVCRCMDAAAFIGRRSFVSAFSSSFFISRYIYIVQRVYTDIEMYMYLVRLRDRWRRAWYIREKRSAGQSTYRLITESDRVNKEEESYDGWFDVSRRLTLTPRNLRNSYV